MALSELYLNLAEPPLSIPEYAMLRRWGAGGRFDPDQCMRFLYRHMVDKDGQHLSRFDVDELMWDVEPAQLGELIGRIADALKERTEEIVPPANGG